MVKFSNYLKQKGQGIVEYALLLAFIVGIAVALQGVGLKDAVVGVFDDVATVLAGVSSKTNLYAENFAKFSTTRKADLKAMDNNKERIDTDLAALENIAKFVMGKQLSDLEPYFGQNWSGWEDQVKKTSGHNIFHNMDEEHDFNNTGQMSGHEMKYEPVIDLMYGGSHDIPYYVEGTSGNSHSWVKEKYFYSNAMLGEDSGRNDRNIKLSVDTDDSGKVTGAHVWVQNNVSSANYSLSDTGSDNKSNLADGIKLGTKNK